MFLYLVYASSRAVADSIPHEVNEFYFNVPNPSSCTMPRGLTEPLTEMSTRNLSGGKAQPASKPDNLIVISEPIVYKLSEPPRLTIFWASTACYRDNFAYVCILMYINITITFWTLSIVLFFYLKHKVSETGFCLRLQVVPTQLGP
jgi:hypothetical protein